MLAEMPVSELTLNELSRRAGLAKSNVLRYFESRPELAALRLDFTVTLGEMLEVMSAGLLTRGDRDDR